MRELVRVNLGRCVCVDDGFIRWVHGGGAGLVRGDWGGSLVDAAAERVCLRNVRVRDA